jgi:hypothetical protein
MEVKVAGYSLFACVVCLLQLALLGSSLLHAQYADSCTETAAYRALYLAQLYSSSI